MVKNETTMDKGSLEGPVKISEPLITVPNPRAFQREHRAAQVTVPTVSGQSNYNHLINIPENVNSTRQTTVPSVSEQSKYVQLLNVIEELGRDIRPSYAGSRSSAERVKRGLIHARILVKECLIEAEKSARQ
ncbi:cyclin-dependent kinase 2-associated protein 1-like [Leptopilina boulardi]|uniref:cyclin-dependent kinase 2-associated protein 1-like n=1 Tax=Leptopilina boulardi TaxID=63433 RepID=UPI0021F62E7A|nr:cyclin-dependent kinase 2-associated protein 1-like [Leptopilina boulardi]